MNKRDITKFRDAYAIADLSDIITDEVQLAVTFDEKDDVKRLGAKWNPDPSGKGGFWSIKRNRLDRDCPIGCEVVGPEWGGTILDWLNNYKMVFKSIGNIRQDIVKQLGTSEPKTTHQLELAPDINNMGANTVLFAEFEGDTPLVRFTDNETGEESWQTADDARDTWNTLIAKGYNRV